MPRSLTLALLLFVPLVMGQDPGPPTPRQRQSAEAKAEAKFYVKITGPTKLRAGKLVILDASKSDAQSYTWSLDLDGITDADFEIFDGGKKIAFATPNPGRYVFTLAIARASATAGGAPVLAVADHVVTLTEPEPVPKPQPEPAPQPIPVPVPQPIPVPTPIPVPAADLSLWVLKNASEMVVADSHRQATAIALAAGFRVVAQFSAGATDPAMFWASQNATNAVALKTTGGIGWDGFLIALRAKVDSLGLLTVADLAVRVWPTIANGLEAVPNLQPQPPPVPTPTPPVLIAEKLWIVTIDRATARTQGTVDALIAVRAATLNGHQYGILEDTDQDAKMFADQIAAAGGKLPVVVLMDATNKKWLNRPVGADNSMLKLPQSTEAMNALIRKYTGK